MFFSPTSVLTLAPCRDLPEEEKDAIFFPTGNSHKQARVICTGCADRAACLDLALSFEIPGEERHGIWGGLTGPERERLVAEEAG